VSVHFRELEVWQVAMRMASTVHLVATAFDKGEHEDTAATLRTAAASVPDAVAQGHSSGCLQEFATRLAGAQDACTTVKAELLRVRERVTGDPAMIDESLALADRVGRMLLRLHQALSRKLEADRAVSGSQSR
jgi:carbamoyl-phosphate synthase large subunit